MGGSWSCALPRHLWTLCHILPGLLYILLHWRVSSHVNLSLAVLLLTVALFRFPRGFAVTLLYGKINSERQLEQCEQSYLPPTQIGILKVMTGSTKQPPPSLRKHGDASSCVNWNVEAR